MASFYLNKNLSEATSSGQSNLLVKQLISRFPVKNLKPDKPEKPEA